ncbi:hypothetical protein HOY80DRAFT_853835, partial [Tuber brumale]
GFLAWDMEGFSDTDEGNSGEKDGQQLACMVRKKDGGHCERHGLYLTKIHNSNGVL